MPGELWRGFYQAAVETTPGTPVTTATRRMYFKSPESVLSREQPPRIHRFATGGRDNIRAVTLGPIAAAGSVVIPMSANELIELLEVGLEGSVAPVSSAWTFRSGGTSWGTPQSMSLQWQDAANPWIESGCQVGRYRISGAKDGESSVTCELFGQNLAVATMTPAAGVLAQRIPVFYEGWQSSLYIDPTTYGSTAAAMLLNWDVTIDNQMGRKYFGNNSLAASAITLGEIDVSAQLTVEASVAAAATEFTNWAAGTLRRVRLSFPSSAAANGVDVDLPGYWSAFDLGQNAGGTRVYRLTLTASYDVTSSFGLRIVCNSSRATAWDNT